MQALRIATKSRTFFPLGELKLGKAWTAVDLRKLSPDQVAGLVKYVGDELLVHPSDAGKLAGLGLALERGRLVRRIANTAAPAAVTAESVPAVVGEIDTAPARRARR